MNKANPYIGLSEFNQESEDNYFGYQFMAEQLTELVLTSNLTLLVGMSGCGKSSFLKACFIPRLESISDPRAPYNWIIERITPEKKGNIISQIENIAPKLFLKPENLIGVIDDESNAFLEYDQEIKVKRKRLLIIDQFEQVFEYQEHSANMVLADLFEILNQTDDLSILLCSRVDFLPNLGRVKLFTENINKNTLFLPMLPDYIIREAIENPALSLGIEIEEKVVDSLLVKVSDIRRSAYDEINKGERASEDDSLPLLQYFLFKLFNNIKPRLLKKNKSKTSISEDEILSLGALDNIIQRSCDEVFHQKDFGKKDRDMVKFLFKYISKQDRFNPKKIVRNPRPLKEIVELYNSIFHHDHLRIFEIGKKQKKPSMTEWRKLIKNFTNSSVGILRMKDGEIDVVHEAVFRQWFRCKEWINSKNKKFETYRAILDNESKKDPYDKIFEFRDHLRYFKQIDYFSSDLWLLEYMEFEFKEKFKISDVQLIRSHDKKEKKRLNWEMLEKCISLKDKSIKRLYRQKYYHAIRRADFHTMAFIKDYNNRLEKDGVSNWPCELIEEELYNREFEKEFYYALSNTHEPPVENESPSKDFNTSSNTNEDNPKQAVTKDIIIKRWKEKDFIKPKRLHDLHMTQPDRLDSLVRLHSYAAFGGNYEYLEALREFVYDSDENNFSDPGIYNVSRESNSAIYHWIFGDNISSENDKFIEAVLDQSGDRNVLLHKSKTRQRNVFFAPGSTNILAIDWLVKLSKSEDVIFSIKKEIQSTLEKLKKFQGLPKEKYDPDYSTQGKEEFLETVLKYLKNIKDAIKQGKIHNENINNRLTELEHLCQDLAVLINPWVNSIDELGYSPIFSACFSMPSPNQFPRIFKENGYPINEMLLTRDENGRSLFYWCCNFKNLEVLKNILDYTKTQKKSFYKALLTLDKSSSSELHKHYLFRVISNIDTWVGPNQELQKSKYPVLDFLLNYDDKDISKIIKEQLNLEFKDGSRLLDTISNDWMTYDLIKLLLISGADPNYQSSHDKKHFYSPLDRSVYRGDLNVVKLFFEIGTVTLKKEILDTGARTAFKTNSFEIYQFLLQKGAKYFPFSFYWKYDSLNFKIDKYDQPHVPYDSLMNPQKTGSSILGPIIGSNNNWVVASKFKFRELLNSVSFDSSFKSIVYQSEPSFVEFRHFNPSFYHDLTISEILIHFDNREYGLLTFITKKENIYRLTGQSPLIHFLNKDHLRITKNNALEYLIFFCSAVHGEEGAFKIIEDTSQLLWINKKDRKTHDDLITAIIEKECTKIREIKKEGKTVWQCKKLVNYSNELFLADFHIQKSGFIEMIDDFSVASKLSIEVEVFEGGIRTTKKIISETKPEIMSFRTACKKELFKLSEWIFFNQDVDTKEKNEAVEDAIENGSLKVIKWLIQFYDKHDVTGLLDTTKFRELAKKNKSKEVKTIINNWIG